MPTNYSGNGTKPTLPIVLINDGEDYTFVTFQEGEMEKVIDWLSFLDAGGASVVGYVGASFTITAGPLQTFLQLLADDAANLSAVLNTFTGKMKIGSGAPTPGTNGLSMLGNIYAALGFSTPGPVALQLGAYVARAATAVSTSATTLSLDPTVSSYYVAEAWAGGTKLPATPAAYAGSDTPEVTVDFHPASPDAVLAVGSIVQLTGWGSVTIRYSGAWHFCRASGDYVITP